ncbi:hypothetical protein NP493_206g00001 [Ridgeia piscesae]|uniref:Uncharacterized protein n=1 Tax=Ridgeia piscesae TaxID=27915 RepID=A0AAD9P193_RIDPI|nr:hypothetical protein NP493_206g00001 [Ridgeia piscesae]
MESDRRVAAVHIHNRADSGCSERLHDLRVGLTGTWPTTGGSSLIAMDAVCATVDGVHPEARLMIQCGQNVAGRYLVIQIEGANSRLTMCEVEVFAVECKYL